MRSWPCGCLLAFVTLGIVIARYQTCEWRTVESTISSSEENDGARAALVPVEGLGPVFTGVSRPFPALSGYGGTLVMLRELLTVILSSHAEAVGDIQIASHTGPNTVRVCQEYEHVLVLNLDPARYPIGKVASIYDPTKNYSVRVGASGCNVSSPEIDIAVEYSMTNVAHYRLSGAFSPSDLDKLVYVPSFEFPFNPFHSPRNMVPITTFTFPNTGRRQKFSEMMSRRNVTVQNKNGVYGSELKQLFDSHAILVNVHQTDEHHTLEEFRILPALLRGVVIISEVSPLLDYVPFSQFVVWSSWDELPAKVAEVVEHYDEYFRKFFGPRSRLPLVLAAMRAKALEELSTRVLRSAAQRRNHTSESHLQVATRPRYAEFLESVLSWNILTDKFTHHRYLPIYWDAFNAVSSLEKVFLFEIGLGCGMPSPYVAGASAHFFRRLFGSRLYYHNFEFQQSCGEKWMAENPGIADQMSFGNQAQPGDLLKAMGGNSTWDIMVDDGSHDPMHQLISLQTLWPFLRRGGTYIVEDVHVAPSFVETCIKQFATFLSSSRESPALLTDLESVVFHHEAIVFRKG